jgi:hypothetical protein
LLVSCDDPEDESDMFLVNFGWLPTDYAALYYQNSSWPPSRDHENCSIWIAT